MKIKQKLLLTIIGISAIILMINPIKSEAALQANGNTSATKTLPNWLLPIRQMEAAGGTLGLTDTIDTTTLLSTATESNNLDIHMEKNTEYGAMAILSASAYGNQNPIPDGGTTTGNKSGVYINLNKEWTAAGTISDSAAYKNAKARYKNAYTNSYVAKVGDAITETAGWHKPTDMTVASTWVGRNDTSGLLRAFSGSIFSYYGYGGYIGTAGKGDAGFDHPWSTRACIVVSSGI